MFSYLVAIEGGSSFQILVDWDLQLGLTAASCFCPWMCCLLICPGPVALCAANGTLHTMPCYRYL